MSEVLKWILSIGIVGLLILMSFVLYEITVVRHQTAKPDLRWLLVDDGHGYTVGDRIEISGGQWYLVTGISPRRIDVIAIPGTSITDHRKGERH